MSSPELHAVSGPRSMSAAPIVLVGAAASALLAALIALDAGGAWRALVALPLVLGGVAAIGPVLLATPVEPSPLKLVVVCSLLAPPLVAGVALALSFGFGVEPALAWAAPFAVSSVTSLAASAKRLGTAPPGRAALVAVAAGLALAVGAAWVSWSPGGLAARATDEATVVHATLAESVAQGVPLSDPWLAGGALDVRPAAAALLAAVATPAGIAPLFALPLVQGWALLALTLLGYLASAAAFREWGSEGAGARDVLAALLVPLSLALGPSVDAVLAGGPPLGPLFEVDPARLLGRTYAIAALFAGLHAVRRGARPWPGLCATYVAIAALLQPWPGAAMALALFCAAFAAGRRATAALMLGTLLPAFVVGRLFGGFAGDQVAVAKVVGALPHGPALLLLALPAALVLPREAGDDASERAVSRCGRIALVLAGITTVVFALAVPPARWDAAGLEALAFAAVAVPAAAGFVAIGARPIGVAIGLGVAGLAAWGGARWGAATLQADPPPLAESADGLQLGTSPSVAVLSDAFAMLHASPLSRLPTAFVLRGGLAPSESGPPEPPSLVPLLTGLGLWGDASPPPGDDQPRFGAGRGSGPRLTDRGDSWSDRRELLDALFRQERRWAPRFDHRLRAEVERGATLVFIVTEADRRMTTDRGSGPRGPDVVARRLGAETVFQSADVMVYVLAP
ncbi:MAG: hypothetical protein AAF726_08050 [Planctomycetota bacterium]